MVAVLTTHEKIQADADKKKTNSALKPKEDNERFHRGMGREDKGEAGVGVDRRIKKGGRK